MRVSSNKYEINNGSRGKGKNRSRINRHINNLVVLGASRFDLVCRAINQSRIDPYIHQSMLRLEKKRVVARIATSRSPCETALGRTLRTTGPPAERER